jgi:hypothetical protein
MARTIVFALALVLVSGIVGAQTPQPGRPPFPPPVFSPQANICSTNWGWCHLPGPQPQNTGCVCLTAAGQQVPGAARLYPTREPPSPYLRPHTTPPL